MAATILFGVVAAVSGPGTNATDGTSVLQRLVASPAATPGAGTPAPATPVVSPLAPHAGSRSVSVTGTVTIRLTDMGFAPDRIQSTNGHDLTVTLVNAGTRPHGFVIAPLDIQALLQPGETTIVTITSPPLGDYTFTSDAPGDDDMTGQLTFYI